MAGTLDLLTRYAAFHRDRRNIATHLVGVPLAVFGLGVLLARPSLQVQAWVLTPAWLCWAAAACWYLTRGDLMLGVAVSAATAALVGLAVPLSLQSTAAWLGLGLFALSLGWALQALGHWYEGRRPAFVDGLKGLLLGPLFVTAQLLFAIGWGKRLAGQIEQSVGPTHVRDLAAIRV